MKKELTRQDWVETFVERRSTCLDIFDSVLWRSNDGRENHIKLGVIVYFWLLKRPFDRLEHLKKRIIDRRHVIIFQK